MKQVLAVSGSASRLSAQQIDAAVQAGFAEVSLDAVALASESAAHVIHAVARQVAQLLLAGRSVVMHTARGNDDPRIAAMVDAMQARGYSREKAKHEGGRLLGERLGALVRDILAAAPPQTPGPVRW
ncbi:nucleotide-binding domain containing protein [Cupriavidus sp. H18C1]|uniref:nucleotide-binding domain containing protein n=1 Tax=Cupriavidus sp. H18C1 TaxID=3241601 RepID=UPI003BB99A03